MNEGHHIFLSYSRDDTSTMLKVRDSLVRAGFTVWTDEKLTAGTPSWRSAIENAINNAGCMVVVLSPSAKNSVWVERELNFGAVRRKRIFPILAEGDELNAIPFELISVQFVDIRSDFDKAMEQLSRGLHSYLELPAPALEEAQPGPSPKRKNGLAKRIRDTGGPLLHDFWVNLVEEAKPTTLLPETRPTIGARIRNTGRLLSWYLLDPRKVLAYKRLGGEQEVTALNAWVLSGLLWTALLVPQLVAFPGALNEVSNLGMALLWLLFPVAWFISANLGMNLRSLREFLGPMVGRMLVLGLASATGILIFLLAAVLFPPQPDSTGVDVPLLSLTIIIGMVCGLLLGSIVGRAAKSAGRWKYPVMIALIALAPTAIGGILAGNRSADDYTSAAIIASVLACVLGLIALGVTRIILRRVYKRSIVNAAGAIVAGGITAWLSTWILAGGFGPAVSRNFSDFVRATPAMNIVLGTTLVCIIGSALTGGILFGLGSQYTVRRADSTFLTQVVIAVLCVLSLATGIVAGKAFTADVIGATDHDIVFSGLTNAVVFTLWPALAGMYAAGITTDALHGVNRGLDFLVMVVVAAVGAFMLAANAFVIGSGLRGIFLVLLVAVAILQSHLYSDAVPRALLLLLVVIAGVGLLFDSTYGNNAGGVRLGIGIDNLIAPLVFAMTIIGGRGIGRWLRRKPDWALLLPLSYASLLVLVAAAYLLNI